MATCAVSGIIKDISETAILGATIKASISNSFFTTTIHIVPKEVSTTSAADGTWTLNLVRGSSAIVTISYPPNATNSQQPYRYSVTVPSAATADFSTIALEL